MSKRQRHLKQRLDELFSTAEESEATPAAAAAVAPAGQSPTPIEAEHAARPPQDDLVRLLTVIEQLPLPAYVKDHEHTWVAINASYGELIGHAPANLIGHTDKEQADEAWQLDDRVLDTGQPAEAEETITLPDGSIHTRRFKRTALFNAQHEVQYVLGLVQEQDVAQQQRIEEDLSKFKLGIDRANAAVTITDVQGTILYVNPAYEKIYGYSREEAIGKNPRILKSGQVSPEEYQRFWAQLLAGEPVTGEIINKAKDGRLVPVETNNTPILDEGGKITGFLSIQYDISKRKQAEADVVKRNNQLTTLNRLGQELTRSVKPEDVLELVFTAIGEVADNRNLYIALYDESKQEITFPIYTIDGERRQVAGRPLGNGMTEHVLHTKAPLLIARDVPAYAASLGIANIGRSSCCYLGVPLLSGEKAVGIIAVQDYEHEDVYATADVELLSTIATQTAAALENARLHLAEGRRALQLQTAAEISSAASTVLDVDELLPFAVNLIQQRFNLYYVGLFFVNDTFQSAVLRAATGEAGRNMLERGHQLPIDDRSMVGWCISHETARIALDIGEDAVRFNNPDLPETHSELALPLISRGQVLGAMSVQSTEAAAFSPQDITVLQTMADQVATAIANAQLLEQSRAASQQAEARLREVQFMQAVGQAVSSTLDLATVLDVIFQTLEQDMGFTHTALAILDKPTDTITIVRASGTAIRLQGLARTVTQLQGDILLDILQKGETEVIDGWDDRLDREIWEREGHAALVRAFVPLRLRREPIGILEVGYWRTDRAQITSDEVRLLNGMADQMAIAVGNARLLEQAQTALAETTRRSEQLVVLNEMGRVLGATLNADTILNTVYTYTSRLTNTDSFFVALYDSTAQTLSFPLSMAYNDKEAVQVEPRPLKAGLTDYIIRHRQPLLLSDNVQAHMAELGIEFLALGNTQPALSWLGVPMLFGDQVLGAIVVQSVTTPGLYREIDRDLLLAVAGQAAIAFNNAHLFDESQRRITELAVVNEISRTLTSAQDVNQLFATIHQQVGRLFDASNFYIATYDGGDEWSLDYQYERNQLLPPARHKLGRGFTSYILQTRQPLLIRSVQDNTAFHEKYDLPKIGETAKSWLGVPLIVAGDITGVMGIQSYEHEGLYDEHNVALFSTIGTQAAAAIQNARLLQEARARANELTALNELSQILASHLSVHQVLEEVWHGVSHLLDTTNFYIALYDPERQEISFPINASESVLDKEITVMPASQGITGYIIRTGQPLLIKEDVPGTLNQLGLENVGESSQSYLGVPIVLGDQVLGAVAIQSYTKARSYNEHDQNLLMAIAGQTAIALQNARLFEQTKKQANEAAALNEIMQEISQRVDLEHILETAYRYIRQLLPTDSFIVALLEGERQLRYPLIYDEGQRFPERSGEARPETNIGHVILTGQPVLINRTSEELMETSGLAVSALGNQQRPSASLLYVPLKGEQKTVGALSIQSYELNAYTPDNVVLVERIANQLAIAIQNAQLFEETRQRNAELATLNQITSSASQTLDLRSLLDMVLKQTLTDFGFDGGLITVYNETRHKLERIVRTGLPGSIPDDPAEGLENSLCAYVFNSKEPLVIEDFRQGGPIDVSGEVEAGYFSYMGVPIEAKGRMLGTWCGFRKFAGPFGKNTLALLQTVSHQAGFAIENAQFFAQTQTTLAETEQLYAASQHLTAATNLQEAVAAMAEGIPVTEINRAALWLFERDEQGQVTAAIVSAGWYSGQGVPVLPTGTRLSAEVIKAMSLVLTAEPLFSDNLKTDQRIDPGTAALLQQQSIGAIAILPLWVAGRQIGAFLLEAEGPHAFTDAEIRPYISLSQQLATTIYNQQLLEQTQRNTQQLTILNELGRDLSQEIELDSVLNATYRHLQRLVPLDAYLVGLREGDTDGIVYPAVYDDGQRYESTRGSLKKDTATTQVMLTGKPILKQLTAQQLATASAVPGTMGNVNRPSASLLYVPLQIGPRIVGVLSVQSYQLNAYTNEHVQIVESIASQVAVAIQNVRLFEQIQRTAKREQTLRELTARVRGSSDPDTIVRTAVRELGLTLGRQTFIRLGDAAQLSAPPAPPAPPEGAPVSGNGSGNASEGGQ